MEEIEYLEEYEDIVLQPGPASNSAGTSATNAKIDNDEGSSSSLDQDIFNILFDNHSDDDNDDQPQARRNEELNTNSKVVSRASVDSIDLLNDLGEQVAKEFEDKGNIAGPSTKKTLNSQKKLSTIAKLQRGCVVKKGGNSALSTKAQSTAGGVQRNLTDAKGPSSTNALSKSYINRSSLPVRTYQSLTSKTIQVKGIAGSPTLKDPTVKRRPATIIKPEKIVSKDPPEDPLNLDDHSSSGYTLSDVSGETYNSISEFDDDENFNSNIDNLDNGSSNSQVIDISNDSSGSRSQFEDLRVSTPSPVISEDRDLSYLPGEPKRSSPKFMANHEIIKSLLNKGEKPKLLQLLNEHDKADIKEKCCSLSTEISSKDLCEQKDVPKAMNRDMESPGTMSHDSYFSVVNEMLEESYAEAMKNSRHDGLPNQEVGAEMEIENENDSDRKDDRVADNTTEISREEEETEKPKQLHEIEKFVDDEHGFQGFQDSTAGNNEIDKAALAVVHKYTASVENKINPTTKSKCVTSDVPTTSQLTEFPTAASKILKGKCSTKTISQDKRSAEKGKESLKKNIEIQLTEFPTVASKILKEKCSTKTISQDKRSADQGKESLIRNTVEFQRGPIRNPFVQRTHKQSSRETIPKAISKDNSQERSHCGSQPQYNNKKEQLNSKNQPKTSTDNIKKSKSDESLHYERKLNTSLGTVRSESDRKELKNKTVAEEKDKILTEAPRKAVFYECKKNSQKTNSHEKLMSDEEKYKSDILHSQDKISKSASKDHSQTLNVKYESSGKEAMQRILEAKVTVSLQRIEVEKNAKMKASTHEKQNKAGSNNKKLPQKETETSQTKTPSTKIPEETSDNEMKTIDTANVSHKVYEPNQGEDIEFKPSTKTKTTTDNPQNDHQREVDDKKIATKDAEQKSSKSETKTVKEPKRVELVSVHSDKGYNVYDTKCDPNKTKPSKKESEREKGLQRKDTDLKAKIDIASKTHKTYLEGLKEERNIANEDVSSLKYTSIEADSIKCVINKEIAIRGDKKTPHSTIAHNEENNMSSTLNPKSSAGEQATSKIDVSLVEKEENKPENVEIKFKNVMPNNNQNVSSMKELAAQDANSKRGVVNTEQLFAKQSPCTKAIGEGKTIASNGDKVSKNNKDQCKARSNENPFENKNKVNITPPRSSKQSPKTDKSLPKDDELKDQRLNTNKGDITRKDKKEDECEAENKNKKNNSPEVIAKTPTQLQEDDNGTHSPRKQMRKTRGVKNCSEASTDENISKLLEEERLSIQTQRFARKTRNSTPTCDNLEKEFQSNQTEGLSELSNARAPTPCASAKEDNQSTKKSRSTVDKSNDDHKQKQKLTKNENLADITSQSTITTIKSSCGKDDKERTFWNSVPKENLSNNLALKSGTNLKDGDSFSFKTNSPDIKTKIAIQQETTQEAVEAIKQDEGHSDSDGNTLISCNARTSSTISLSPKEDFNRAQGKSKKEIKQTMAPQAALSDAADKVEVPVTANHSRNIFDNCSKTVDAVPLICKEMQKSLACSESSDISVHQDVSKSETSSSRNAPLHDLREEKKRMVQTTTKCVRENLSAIKNKPIIDRGRSLRNREMETNFSTDGLVEMNSFKQPKREISPKSEYTLKRKLRSPALDTLSQSSNSKRQKNESSRNRDSNSAVVYTPSIEGSKTISSTTRFSTKASDFSSHGTPKRQAEELQTQSVCENVSISFEHLGGVSNVKTPDIIQKQASEIQAPVMATLSVNSKRLRNIQKSREKVCPNKTSVVPDKRRPKISPEKSPNSTKVLSFAEWLETNGRKDFTQESQTIEERNKFRRRQNKSMGNLQQPDSKTKYYKHDFVAKQALQLPTEQTTVRNNITITNAEDVDLKGQDDENVSTLTRTENIPVRRGVTKNLFETSHTKPDVHPKQSLEHKDSVSVGEVRQNLQDSSRSAKNCEEVKSCLIKTSSTRTCPKIKKRRVAGIGRKTKRNIRVKRKDILVRALPSMKHEKVKGKRTEIDILIESMSKEMKDGGIEDLLNTSNIVKRQRISTKRRCAIDSGKSAEETTCAEANTNLISTKESPRKSPVKNCSPQGKHRKSALLKSSANESFLMEAEKALIDEIEIKNMNTCFLQPMPSGQQKNIHRNKNVNKFQFKAPHPPQATILQFANAPSKSSSSERISHINENISDKGDVDKIEISPSSKFVPPMMCRKFRVRLNSSFVRKYWQILKKEGQIKTQPHSTHLTKSDTLRNFKNARKLHDATSLSISKNKEIGRNKISFGLEEAVGLNQVPNLQSRKVSAKKDYKKDIAIRKESITPSTNDLGHSVDLFKEGRQSVRNIQSLSPNFEPSDSVKTVSSALPESVNKQPVSSVSEQALPVELKNEFIDENPTNMDDAILPDTPTLMARAQSITQAAASALSNTIMPTDIRLLTNDPSSTTNTYVPSFGVSPTLVDSKGTRMYTFLHPAKYSRNHGNVLLDFCCPNLDGPMPAIDPTRIHAQVQTPVIELPSFIVLTTKVVTRAELESNSSVIPAIIRKKAEKLRNSIALHQNTSAPPHIQAKAIMSVPQTLLPPHTRSPVAITMGTPQINTTENQLSPTVNALTKYLPSTTTITPKLCSSLPQSTFAVHHSCSPNTNLISPITVVPNSSAMLNEMQINLLRSNLRRFDVIFKKLVQPFDKLNFAERHQIIDNLVSIGKFLPKDLERTIVLMEEYLKQINKLHEPQISSLNNYAMPIAETLPTLPIMQMPPLQPSPQIASSQQIFNSTTSRKQVDHPETNKARRVESTQKNNTTTGKQRQVPIYDTERNIIGYQLQVIAPPQSTVPSHTKPTMSPTTSKAVVSSTSLDSANRNQKKPVKRPANDSPRIFYASQPLKASTPKISLNSPTYSSKTLTQDNSYEKSHQGHIVTTVRSAGPSAGTETITTTTTLATVKRITRSRAAGSKIIIVSRSNSNEESILPDINQQTEIKNEKDIDFVA
uniref:Uncharacterized protein n=1 Tax=Stomoxys calcitrans TaxID=35570 RepID=A0A1I8PGD5_STOCA